jgi:hypothetical protein
LVGDLARQCAANQVFHASAVLFFVVHHLLLCRAPIAGSICACEINTKTALTDLQGDARCRKSTCMVAASLAFGDSPSFQLKATVFVRKKGD